jgi:DnaK suppressor protein
MHEFSEHDLNTIYLQLRARESALRERTQQSSSSSAVVELDQSKVGRLSRMDALQAQAMSKAADTRCIDELRRIKSALSRLESGDYGFCDECGEAISPQRLNIDPSATLCIGCANKAEI